MVNTIRQMRDYTKCLQELVSEKIKIKEVSTVKLNARCSDVLQNELSPKEKDPRSFILSCIIGNTTVSNALTDLGVLISVMSFSMFKRLGLRTPKPDSMVIEMKDKSMQSPKGIVENVLVKIDKFIFPMDFVILDIVEDSKVPIILGKPMLTTAHARIGVFDRKISMDVGTKKVVFNVNEGKTPLSVCVLNDFQVPEEFEETEGLEEFLMNDDINEDLGDFLEEIDLLAKIDWDTLEVIFDSDDEMGIRLEDLGEGIENF
ncbi:retrovirus-related pol polyprotein from transposon TNT 1-94 [Tanacetum coccineum]|uniref:Retrovirus-related pol polyprotein from transposon TNT 1-94 n=1 Tax=Tanacetum coccineum TaxID=301880 RepID=A0ABQ4ZD20_9ASTR